MFKINGISVFIYLLLKYIVFFTVLAFVGDRFKHIVLDNATTHAEIFKLSLDYTLYVIIYIIPMILIMFFPLQFILTFKSTRWFIFFILLLYIAEYFIYTYLYASSDKSLGVYNLVIGVIILWIFFYKSIIIKFRTSKV
ncbi:hypothetical protein FHR29_000837 [Sphingobacterium sp. JUb56]|nr:hypothetical protein [Sphingobacterium sp. JUb56]